MASEELQSLLKDVEETPVNNNTESQNIRSFFQGLSFGFADEIEAAIQSAVDSDKTYAETLNEIRGKIKDFRESNPGAAIATEIAGSIPSMILAQFIPGAGQTATAARIAQLARTAGIGAKGQKIGGSALRGAAASGVYGFGTGEGGLENRLEKAGTSAAIGAALNPAIQSVAPRITEGAKELIKKGVDVTAGQATKGSGLIGTMLDRAEQSAAGTVFGIGDSIKNALVRARVGFNRATANEALAPIGVKVPKTAEGRDIIRFADKTFRTNYRKILDKVKINNTTNLTDELNTIVQATPSELKNKVNSRVQDIILKETKDGQLSGKKIKKIQEKLRIFIDRNKAGNPDDKDVADIFQNIRSVLVKEIVDQNPTQGKKLLDLDKAYGNFRVVAQASTRSKVGGGIFTPGDILQESAKGKGKRAFETGTARMQRMGELGQSVIGNTVPDSGTAGRLITGGLLTANPVSQLGSTAFGSALDPVSFGIGLSPVVGGALAYSGPFNRVFRNVVAGTGRTMQSAVPVTSQMLAQQLMNGT
tara:strand:- start:44 stop:1645 length:1602 start_codon:yes stop_codon:yes gene_type:complete